MKKTLLLTFLLTTTFFADAQSPPQVRIVAVEPATGMFILQNFGTTPVNVSSHQMCAGFSYTSLSSLNIVIGSLTIDPGEATGFSGWPLNATASDLGYYTSGPFGDVNNMQDFVQWGSGGNGREGVAVSKGIWTAGDFIPNTGVSTYTGNGFTDNGVQFWEGFNVGIEEVHALKQLQLYPNPTTSEVSVDLSGISAVTMMEVFSVKGELVLTQQLNPNSLSRIELTNMKSGLYFVNLHNNVATVRKKLVIR